MLMGDHAPPPLVAADELPAAAMLPHDLSVVTAGTNRVRTAVVAAGVLLAAVVARMVFGHAVASTPLLGVGSVLLGAAGLRLLARERREYRLTDQGLEVEMRAPADRRPRIRRIPFSWVQDFTVSVTPAGATLRVLSVSGYTITLHDPAPGLATRELLHRFADRAAPLRRHHHPREGLEEALAESPELRALVAGADEVPPLRTAVIAGMAGFGAVVFSGVTAALGWPLGRQAVVGAGIGAVALTLWLWLRRDDPGAEWSERPARRWMARIRNRLRRLLDMR